MCQTNWVKTFDRIVWDIVFSTLQKFGYANKFIEIIKAAFTNSNLNSEQTWPLSDPFTPYVRSSPRVSNLNAAIHYCIWGTFQFHW